MNKFAFLTFLLIFSTNIFAQNRVAISGSVLDGKNEEVVPQASIRVLAEKDSAFVTGNVSDISGNFSIPVNVGNYILQFSYLGYSDTFVNVSATKANNKLGKVYLKENSILLDEAIITAKAVEIVVKEDTVEYNADSYKVQPSAVVEDLIKKMPGAEVDENGVITINGKEIKKILVDGKEFFSDDPKVASKNLPAAMVNKLQVYDRKSDMAMMTGFDDGDDVAVINLTVKPGMKQGVFGNAYAGYGSDDRYEANAMVNYMQNNNQFSFLGGANNTNNAGFSDFASSMFGGNRPRGGMNFGGRNGITTSINGGLNFATEFSEKFKLGGDVRYGNSDNNVVRDSYTEYTSNNVDSVQYENKHSAGDNKSDNLGVNLRMEWRPDEATTIIFKPNIQYNKNTNTQISDYLTTMGLANDSINWGSSSYRSEGDGYSLSGELEVSRKLNDKGRVLSFSVSGGISDQESDGYNKSSTFFKSNEPDKIIDQIFNQTSTGHNWRGYVSYVEPLGKNYFLQLNYSYRKNYTESDNNTYALSSTNQYDSLDVSSSRFLKNDFRNQEIGLNFKGVREKYNYTLGVALQPSNTETWETRPRVALADTTYYTKNNVLNFSPVAQFNYQWSKQKNMRIEYKGTVNQPSTKQLSTAVDESNPMSITYGNPDLKPSFENRLRVRFRNFNDAKASTLMLMANASFTTNDIVSYSSRDNLGREVSTYKNINGNWNADARLIYNTPFSTQKNNDNFLDLSKFSVSTMTYIRYSESNGFVNERENNLQSTSFTERAGITYRSDLFDFGIDGNFRYTSSINSLDDQTDRRFYNYGAGANTTIYLPFDLTVESDINYSTNSGYTEGFSQNEWLWNASLAKQIFKNKNGTLRIKFYDILKQRSNISQSVSTSSLQQSITNTIGSYFMVHFVYKFQIFKGGAKASDMDGGSGRFGGRGPGGPPPGRF